MTQDNGASTEPPTLDAWANTQGMPAQVAPDDETSGVHSVGRKFDQGKVRPLLLLDDCGHAFDAAVRVATKGGDRHGDRNWLELDDARRRYTNALMRHLRSWLNGDRWDNKGKHPTNEHHLACVIVNAMFLCEKDMREHMEAEQ
jgi:hypothetical protein